jgi:hypothetical protein
MSGDDDHAVRLNGQAEGQRTQASRDGIRPDLAHEKGRGPARTLCRNTSPEESHDPETTTGQSTRCRACPVQPGWRHIGSGAAGGWPSRRWIPVDPGGRGRCRMRGDRPASRGTYNERVIAPCGLRLIGAGVGATILDGTGLVEPFISALVGLGGSPFESLPLTEGYELADMTIRAGRDAPAIGVGIGWTQGAELHDLTIEGFGRAIAIATSMGGSIHDVRVEGPRVGGTRRHSDLPPRRPRSGGSDKALCEPGRGHGRSGCRVGAPRSPSAGGPDTRPPSDDRTVDSEPEREIGGRVRDRGRQDRGASRGKAEAFEDGAGRLGRVDRRQDTHAPMAHRALERVHLEHSPHQFGPGVVPWARAARPRIAGPIAGARLRSGGALR